jgi:hypothetical protein
MSPRAFDVHPDPRCLRGLHFVYVAPALAEPARLIERIRARYPHQLVEGCERWGELVVQRLIVQFRFELRLGARPGEISLLHRVTASAAQRAHDRDQLEASLLDALAEGAPP